LGSTAQWSSTRILVVEDEEITREWMLSLLDDGGYWTAMAGDAATARAAYAAFRPHVVLLDLTLPDADDFELTRTLATRSDCGVIIVSSSRGRNRRLDGLRSGADDFLSKPCDPDELLLKVGRLAERVRDARKSDPAREAMRYGPWLVDFANRLCRHDDGREMTLTDREAQLLDLLLGRPGHVFSRDALRQHLCGGADAVSDRAIDSCVSRLRRKLEKHPGRPEWLQSIYGAGYRFASPFERGNPDDR